jgi:sarcosine/dimethylglycine N-methyltransferase
MSDTYSAVVETARTYYNSDDADNFYFHVWGGEDIHIGIYDTPDEAIADASRRTVERMAALVPGLGPTLGYSTWAPVTAGRRAGSPGSSAVASRR